MKSLQEDIKEKRFKPLYLLYGEENYLKRSYRDKLKNAIVGDADSMNVSRFEGKHIGVSDIIGLAETLPFFAERRLILVENSGFFKNQTPELAGYLTSIEEDPSSTILFVEEEVDKRGKMFKAVKARGRETECKRQEEKVLIRWILGTLKKEGRQITESVMHLFLSRSGNDMEQIEKELEKLICYTYGRDVITAEDVGAVCSTQISNRIFDMVRAIAEKKKKEAIEYYYDLVALREAPMRILFLIARQFHLLLLVKELKGCGFERSEIGKRVGLPPFIVGKYEAQAGRFSAAQLQERIRDCVEMEEGIKTGKMNDRLGLEVLIIRAAM